MHRLRDALEAIGVWAIALFAVAFDWFPRRYWREIIAVVIALIVFASCWAWRIQSPIQTKEIRQYTYYIPLVAKPEPSPKRGVALTYNNCDDTKTLGVTWQYGWTPQPMDCPGVENIPMIRDASNVGMTIGGNSQWLMGFNEPDLSGQANMTPSEAATLWRRVEELYPGRKLVAPAPSQLHPSWIINFRNAYITQFGQPPRLDALAMHWYGWYADDLKYLIEYFKSLAHEWNIPEVWLTEFAFPTLPPPNECFEGAFETSAIEEMKLLSYLENDAMITRYAQFANRIPNDDWGAGNCKAPLMDWGTNKLGAWGRIYSGELFP